MEDDDAFLYGDNNEEKTQQTLEQENKEVHEITNVGSDKESNKSKDQAETSLYKDENPATVSDDNKSANASDDDDKESANESGSEYDDDSDDSLEVIISTKKEEEEKKEAEKEEKETDGATLLNSVQESLATLKGGQGKLDMLTVPLIKDIDMYEFDIDTLEDKAWRKPGADITDYFNFGFTEQTWKVYCLKQKRLRSELTTRTMVNATGGDDKMDISAEVRALSSGMGSMLGGSMPNLPGMPNLPNLAMLGASMNPEMMMRSQMMMGPGVPPNIPPFFPNAIQRPPMPNMMGGPQGQQNDPNRNLPKTSMNIQ
ncbi:pre-mRNA 3-end-processing factor fip1l1 [Mycoemilia scoparia]|uniref:Pre-mRNA 3-end-processing factor fip1l1 n=1 Tax=Mycoemilia scoparia TaxID=417184 RepID=A0A9W8A2S8_9FUNG|nr:pre-mRNA 3-end-processing factor fip1l1 [Mycoemilia scoparia]